MFQLSSLCHISIKVEEYKLQNALKQCDNCQTFGHVWANCKHPHPCLWCGGGHLHRDSGEGERIFNTGMTEGDAAHSANYCGCRHAKEKMWKKKSQETSKNTTGRVF
jgi:hypothetical protein